MSEKTLVAPDEVDYNFRLSYEDKTNAERFLSILSNVPRCLRYNQQNLWVPFEHRIDPEGQIYSFKQDTEWVTVDLVNIRDVRVGKYARKTSSKVNAPHITQLMDNFTIIYGPNCVKLTFLDLCNISSDFDVKKWAHSLMAVSYNIYERNICQLKALKRTYYRFMLGLNESETEVKTSMINKFWGGGSDLGEIEDQTFPIEEFTLNVYKDLFFTVADCPFMHKLYNSLKEGPYLTLRRFSMFLKTTQNESFAADAATNKNSCKFLLKEFEQDPELIKADKISYRSFCEYFMSPYNTVVSKESIELHHDMSLPLPKYYIKSSHNTYLPGHQLKGESSVEMYRQVLLTGCRCVELDCYNDGMTEVKITHGKYSLVKEILFKDAIEAIAESAFKTSEYPVILSFENHCSERNQGTMGKYCIEIFKDLLLSAPLESHPLAKDVQLPSPNDLKFKIMVKNKKSKLNAAGKSEDPIPVDTSDVSVVSNDSLKDSKADVEELIAVEDTELSEVGCTDKTLSNIINYIEPVSFRSFSETIEKAKYYEMSSFNEDKALALARGEYQMFIKYNLNNNSRIYPKNSRINSVNFVPHDFWAVGCQMVALNYQSVDLGMSLNLAFYQINANCGYLLKPEHLRAPQTVMNSISNSVQNSTQHTLTVTLCFGNFLAERKSVITVEVELFGIPEDCLKHKSSSFVIESHNVDFKKTEFKFPLIKNIDVSLLRFTVTDERQAICLGCRTIPMMELKNGYRYVELKTEFCQAVPPAALFVKFLRDVYIPEDTNDIANFLLNVSLFAGGGGSSAGGQNHLSHGDNNNLSVLSKQSSHETPEPSSMRSRTDSLITTSNNNAFMSFVKNKKSNLTPGNASEDHSSIFEFQKSSDALDELNKYFNTNMKPDLILARIFEEKKFSAKFESIKSKIAEIIDSNKKEINKSGDSTNRNSLTKMVMSFSMNRKNSIILPNQKSDPSIQNPVIIINKVRAFHSVIKLSMIGYSEKLMKAFKASEKFCFENDMKNLDKEHKRTVEMEKLSCFDSVKKNEKYHDNIVTEKILHKVKKLDQLSDSLNKLRIAQHEAFQSKFDAIETTIKTNISEIIDKSLDELGTPNYDAINASFEFIEFYNLLHDSFYKAVSIHSPNSSSH